MELQSLNEIIAFPTQLLYLVMPFLVIVVVHIVSSSIVKSIQKVLTYTNEPFIPKGKEDIDETVTLQDDEDEEKAIISNIYKRK